MKLHQSFSPLYSLAEAVNITLSFKKVSYWVCGLLIVSGLPTYANAQQKHDTGPYMRANLGGSFLSDATENTQNIGASHITGQAALNMKTGFVAGLGLGYQTTHSWGIELAWEYRTNDSETVLSNGEIYDGGNFASNFFFINGLYTLNDWSTRIKPYVGAGIAWVQEVDIDLESNGQELSYSGGGDIGWQVFTGVDYRLSSQWVLQAEVRYQSITGVDLDAEASNTGSFIDVDYHPATLQAAVKYNF